MEISDLRPFARYVAVAAVVGVITVGLREGLAAMMPDLPGQYAWTMLLSYTVGVVLSYFAQARLTFGASNHAPSRRGMASFAVLALISALLTALVAYVLRFGTPLQAWWPTLAPALAFAVAALLVAPVSFFLGRQLVFVSVAPTAGPTVPGARWAWLAMVLMVAVHMALLGQVQLRYNAHGAQDEALFMHLARNLVEGHWLGPYSSMTLVKGPGFALWLAAMNALHLPISWGAALTYALPCGLAFFALRPLLPCVWSRLAVFVALLWCPVALGGFLVMRELIYPALTLLVVTCGLGLALQVESLAQRIQPWAWAAALGLASALFTLTREEAVWLLPLWLGLGMRAAWLLWSGRIGAMALGAAVVVTTLTSLLPLLVVASLNHHYYGVFKVLEVNSQPFVSAYAAISRVRSVVLPQVPVPRAVWGRLAAASPAFAELHVHLEGTIGTGWANNTPSVTSLGALIDQDPTIRGAVTRLLQLPQPPASGHGAEVLTHQYHHDPAVRQRIETMLGGPDNARGFFENVNEIGAGWFLWALRDSAAATGHHASAIEADRFYRRLADEVNSACARGVLSCNVERSSLRPPFDRTQLEPFGVALLTVSGFVPQLLATSTGGPVRDLGTREQLGAAEAFVNDRLATGPATLPVVEPLETMGAMYRHYLPWITGLAAVGWLMATPLRRNGPVTTRRKLWWVGLLLLTLVLARLALVALIHVSAWPVIDLRYMSPAHPLLVFFDAIGLLLLLAGWQQRRRAPS